MTDNEPEIEIDSRIEFSGRTGEAIDAVRDAISNTAEIEICRTDGGRPFVVRLRDSILHTHRLPDWLEVVGVSHTSGYTLIHVKIEDQA